MKNESALKVGVKPFGPTTEQLTAIGALVASHASVRKFVGHAKARLLYVEAIDEEGADKPARPKPPSPMPRTGL
jgi:hypothetical protein